MNRKRVIYISGPITGVKNYWEAFERAEEDLIGLGYIPLSPAHLPEGMTKEQYMRINFALIDSADAVVFLPGWSKSDGALLERKYCTYIGKPVTGVLNLEDDPSEVDPRGTALKALRNDLDKILSSSEAERTRI